MAGANNAQMKVAGWKARDITKARAERKGYEPATRAKPAARAESGAPAGWKAAAKGEGKEQRQAATAARGDYLKGQAAAAGKARRGELAGRGLRDVAGAMMANRKAAASVAKASKPPAPSGQSGVGARIADNLRQVRRDAAQPRPAMALVDKRLSPVQQAASNIVASGRTLVVRRGDRDKRTVYEIKPHREGGATVTMYSKPRGRKVLFGEPIRYGSANDAVNSVRKATPAGAIEKAVRVASAPTRKQESRFDPIRNVPQINATDRRGDEQRARLARRG